MSFSQASLNSVASRSIASSSLQPPFSLSCSARRVYTSSFWEKSPGLLGSMCTWRWGIVWPAPAPSVEESCQRNLLCPNSLTLNAYGCAVNHIVPLEENIHFLNEQEEISHFRRLKVFQFSYSPLWDYQYVSRDHRFFVHKNVLAKENMLFKKLG